MNMQTYNTAQKVAFTFRKLEEVRNHREDVTAGLAEILVSGGHGMTSWLHADGSLVMQKLRETLVRELDILIERYEKELKELLKHESRD